MVPNLVADKIIVQFNTRDEALLLWLLVGLIWTISQKNLRNSMMDVMRAAASPKILVIFVALGAYVFVEVSLVSKIWLWSVSLLKDTGYWLLGTAIVLVMNVSKLGDFKKVIKDAVSAAIMLEFVLNLYTFPLSIELMLIPTVFFLFCLAFVAETKPVYSPAKKVVTMIIGLVGLSLLIHTAVALLGDLRNLVSLQHVRELILQPLLTMALVPFLYAFALLCSYDNVFSSITFWANKHNDKVNVGRAIKWQIFKQCRLNLAKLKIVSKRLPQELWASVDQVETTHDMLQSTPRTKAANILATNL